LKIKGCIKKKSIGMNPWASPGPEFLGKPQGINQSTSLVSVEKVIKG